MSNPWSRGSVTTWPRGPNQSPDNFSSLASGAAKTLGVLSNGTPASPWGDIVLPAWKITLASSPTTGGLITRYLLFSEDNTVWPGGLDPTLNTDQSATLAAAIAADTGFGAALIDTITVQSGTTGYETRWQTIRGLVGNVPSYCSIIIKNGASVAFAAYSSSNQVANYALETYV